MPLSECNPWQISVTRLWFSYAGCAIAHQSPIRIKAWRIELTPRYRCPWPGYRPQKTLCSSPRPYQSIASAIAQFRGFRFERSNPMWLAARAQRHCKRSGWRWRAINKMVLPTRRRRCHRHPLIVKRCSGEGARTIVRHAIAHDVITGAGELVSDRLDRHNRQSLAHACARKSVGSKGRSEPRGAQPR